MRISIQQPEYFPWIGFFNKIINVDKTVFLDNVQFKKRYFENRNKIRSHSGWSWIKTPVLTKGKFTQDICNVRIDNSQPWQNRLITTLRHNYQKSPYWQNNGEELCTMISAPYDRLVDFNLALIRFLIRKFRISCDYCLASSLKTKANGSDLILEICKKLVADEYLSGQDGRNYLNLSDFENHGISVTFQAFSHPEYIQKYAPFIPGMSSIDLFFNHGPTGINLINGPKK